MAPRLPAHCQGCGARVFLCVSPLHWSDYPETRPFDTYTRHKCVEK